MSKTDSQKYLAKMKQIVIEGGEIALRSMAKSAPTLKPDQSVLTKADLEISKLGENILSDLLATPNHILIDEESSGRAKHFNQAVLKNTSFVWVLDPIDGTRLFANKMPIFSISIGLLKDLKPWLGMVYFPLLGELFYSDGEKSFFAQNAFTKNEEKIIITPIDAPITSQSIFFGDNFFSENFNWNFSDCKLMNLSCSTLHLCWSAINRGCGTFFYAHLWDFAGAWPIFQSAGLQLRSYKTGEEIDTLDVELFESEKDDPWKLDQWYILSSARNFNVLKEKITPKS